MNTSLSLLERQFIVFKTFLSMRKIFLSDELENLIKVAYFNSMAGSIDLDAPEEYFHLLLETIEKTKTIYSDDHNFRIKTENEGTEDVKENTEIVSETEEPQELHDPKKLLSKYSNLK